MTVRFRTGIQLEGKTATGFRVPAEVVGALGRGKRPPVLVTGDVTGRGFQYELLVGFTRLGNLLGLLDREEVPELKRHRVWVGAQSGRVG